VAARAKLKAFAEGPPGDCTDSPTDLFVMAEKKYPGLLLTRYLSSDVVYGKQNRLATPMSKKKKKKSKKGCMYRVCTMIPCGHL
jgi:hypothetical protein